MSILILRLVLFAKANSKTIIEVDILGMPSKKHRKLNIFFIIIGGVILALAFIYFLGLYPIAVVRSKFISNNEYEENLELAKRFTANPNRSLVFNELVEAKQKEILLDKYKISKTGLIANELKYYKTGNSAEYQELLQKYFSNNEKLFVDFVVARQAYDSALKIKYNQDFGANNTAYNRAANILKQIQSGSSFEELALSSDDKVSGQVGGDLGFIASGQILPELEKVINISTIGEVKKELVISRLGYHILYPVEISDRNGEKVWHIKHILIQTTGYDQWLEDQLKSIVVRRLINF